MPCEQTKPYSALICDGHLENLQRGSIRARVWDNVRVRVSSILSALGASKEGKGMKPWHGELNFSRDTKSVAQGRRETIKLGSFQRITRLFLVSPLYSGKSGSGLTKGVLLWKFPYKFKSTSYISKLLFFLLSMLNHFSSFLRNLN